MQILLERFLYSCICFIVLLSCGPEKTKQIETKAQQEFTDLRFGMFIHFGLYSVAAGVWKGDTLPLGTIAEHIMRIKSIPREEYHQLAKKFNPYNFNAQEIVSIAKQAGMQYIVFTAKHHDGFAMFDSDYDDYNIKDGTPYGRDILEELSEECRKQGIKLGLYYSHVRDWDEYHSVDIYGNNWDWKKEDSARNLQTYLRTKVKTQLTELLTNYGDIFCLWFDTPGNISPEQATEIFELVKKLQPSCLINSRIGAGLGDYGVMGDNQIPPGVLEGAWECPATINHSWGFHCADSSWKSNEHLIMQLVDLSSKNINYLLNIGPKKDGSIPRESVQRLEEMGEWVSANEEVIYKTGSSPWFQEMDGIRVTTGKDVLYITLLDNYLDNITLYNLKNEIIKVSDIHDRISVPFEYGKINDQDINVLRIALSKEWRDKKFPVIKIKIKGEPEVNNQPCQMSSGNVILQVGMAEVIKNGGSLQISGMNGVIDTNNWPYFATQNWHNSKSFLKWQFNLIEPGTFEVQVINVSTFRDLNSYSKKWKAIFQKSEDYNKVSFNVNGVTLTGKISGIDPMLHIRSEYRPEFINRIGSIRIDKPGIYSSVLKAEFINPKDVDGLVIYEVRLKKLDE